MSIEVIENGDVFASGAEALVNPVNCVGVAGKGLALEFRRRFPGNFLAYVRSCRDGWLQPGRVLTSPAAPGSRPPYVFNFPTKIHWRDGSALSIIESGIPALVAETARFRAGSIAIPALGCGEGGLRWEDVRPLLEAAFSDAPGVRALLHPPRR